MTDSPVEGFQIVLHIVLFESLTTATSASNICLDQCVYLPPDVFDLYDTMLHYTSPITKKTNAKGIKTNKSKEAHQPVCSEISKENINRNHSSTPSLHLPATQLDSGSQH